MTEEQKSMVLYNRAADGVAIPDAVNLRAIATDLLNSGLYPNAKSATQAIAIIAAGRELGLGPTASLQNIAIVNGKMCAEAKVWLALFHGSGGKTRILKRDKESCRIEFSKAGREVYVHEYTWAQATQEGLTTKGGAWGKMPETMLQWRCVSNGIRAYDPGVMMGISLTVDEAEDYPNGIPAGEPSAPGPALEPTEVKPPETAKKGPGRPRAQKPAPEAAPEAEKPATAQPEAKPAHSSGAQGFDVPEGEGDPGEDIAKEAAKGRTEEDEVVDRLKAELTTAGVDERAFKEWLFDYQSTMNPKRRFVVKMKGALRFHGGDLQDLKFLVGVILTAVAKFRYDTANKKA